MHVLIPILRIGTASVWMVFGFICKVLNVVPRHQDIVAMVLGDAVARPVTLLIGGAETAMGIWILTGRRPRTCMVAQTVAIVSMNAVEITMARALLLAPVWMICANAVFLSVGWYLAGHTAARVRKP